MQLEIQRQPRVRQSMRKAGIMVRHRMLEDDMSRRKSKETKAAREEETRSTSRSVLLTKSFQQTKWMPKEYAMIKQWGWMT